MVSAIRAEQAAIGPGFHVPPQFNNDVDKAECRFLVTGNGPEVYLSPPRRRGAADAIAALSSDSGQMGCGSLPHRLDVSPAGTHRVSAS